MTLEQRVKFVRSIWVCAKIARRADCTICENSLSRECVEVFGVHKSIGFGSFCYRVALSAGFTCHYAKDKLPSAFEGGTCSQARVASVEVYWLGFHLRSFATYET